MSHSMVAPKGSGVGMSDSVASLPANPEAAGGWGQVRRHVVKHDWRSIRDALFVGRNEHMSDVDDCVSLLCSPCSSARNDGLIG
jgi:5'-nucleotidase